MSTKISSKYFVSKNYGLGFGIPKCLFCGDFGAFQRWKLFLCDTQERTEKRKSDQGSVFWDCLCKNASNSYNRGKEIKDACVCNKILQDIKASLTLLISPDLLPRPTYQIWRIYFNLNSTSFYVQIEINENATLHKKNLFSEIYFQIYFLVINMIILYFESLIMHILWICRRVLLLFSGQNILAILSPTV